MSVPAPDTHPARVLRAWDETPALRGVLLDAGALAQRHRAPGQYVRLSAGAQQGFFALANAPGDGGFELLIKRGAPAADAVATLSPGDTLAVSEPAGPGYPLDRHRGMDVVLVAAGAGIAPIRAVVCEVVRRRGDFGRVRLYYGHRTLADAAYRAEEPAWSAADVEVTHVLSAPDHGWSGARGHVQHALEARPPAVDGAVAYVCGMRPMVEGVTAALERLGLGRDRVFLNF